MTEKEWGGCRCPVCCSNMLDWDLEDEDCYTIDHSFRRYIVRCEDCGWEKLITEEIHSKYFYEEE